MEPEGETSQNFEYLKIKGFRGFKSEQVVYFAIPTGDSGSGLTVFVGPNNSGKSTAIEALQSLIGGTRTSFSQGRRNIKSGDEVSIKVRFGEAITEVKSARKGSSEVVLINDNQSFRNKLIQVLESRRAFKPFFSKSSHPRQEYIESYSRLENVRQNARDQFSGRLFKAQGNQDEFNAVLSKVLNPVPDWSIDQLDSGQYFLRINRDDAFHSSEGMGQGLISLFFIIDALYESEPGQLIAIDEPELSLHPSLQKRLARLLAEYAKDRQIVLATHSPYFVNLEYMSSGATIIRATSSDAEGTMLHQLSQATAARLAKFFLDLNNPHVLGLKAQEVFFLDEHPILVEGQEDVVMFPKVEEALGIKLDGELYGWGVGGAEKMKTITQALKELGFPKVVGIVDGNRKALVEELQAEFPDYHFAAIPADDIRTKSPRPEFAGIYGLLDEQHHMREEYAEDTAAMIQAANNYLG